MGTMDEAIREHLELKRKLGASEEELERKENEAFGRGAAGVAAASAPPSDVAEPPGDVAEPPAPEPPAEAVASPEPTPPADILDEEIGPDEVLPEESLQPEPAACRTPVRSHSGARPRTGLWSRSRARPVRRPLRAAGTTSIPPTIFRRARTRSRALPSSSRSLRIRSVSGSSRGLPRTSTSTTRLVRLPGALRWPSAKTLQDQEAARVWTGRPGLRTLSRSYDGGEGAEKSF